MKDIETFPKTQVTHAFVERERQARRNAGAVSSEITETETSWILTTIWPE